MSLKGKISEEKSSSGSGSSLPGWAHIDFNEIELGDRIGGGGVGVVYKGS